MQLVFSDIDGTLQHQPEDERERGVQLLLTPPSASGRQAVISAPTIQKVAALRAGGVKFVIITGARASTLLMRMPYLPAADAYVCENGGRIFYPGSDLALACPLTEDEEWRRSLDFAAGPSVQEALPPAQREGPLWDWYRTVSAAGWQVDARGYTTSFRVVLGKEGGRTYSQLQELMSQAPSQLKSSINLGAADFYPNTSGKVGAARHVAERFGTPLGSCGFLCDDDNDLELAAVVARAYLPSVTSESVAQAVEARPGHFVVATMKGTEATEEVLDVVAQHCGLAVAPALVMA